MADTLLYLFAADTHLRPAAWVHYPDLCGDAYYSFEQLIDMAIAESVPLILGGDIFDEARPDPRSVAICGQQLRRAEANGVAVYFVQGDHDYHPTTPWPCVAGTATHLHQRSVTLGGLHLYGLDWGRKSTLAEALATVPATADILITHQGWAELQGIGDTEGRLCDVPHVKTVFSGDYHVTLSKLVSRGDDNWLMVHSPGSTCMQSVKEAADKFCLAVYRTAAGDVAVERRQLLTRSKYECTYMTADELTGLEADIESFKTQAAVLALQLPESLQRPILRVTYADDQRGVLERIREVAGDTFHLFLNPKRLEHMVTVDADTVSRSDFATLETACRALAQTPQEANLAVNLLNAPDKQAELERFYADIREKHERRYNASQTSELGVGSD
jgi:hypothetical protein